MAKYRELLKDRNFILLWLSQIISQLGDRLDQMALIALVYLRAPGSAFEVAKILSFTILPVFIIGPIAGVYVDRWDKRRTMYVCDILRSLLVLIIPLFLFYSKSFIPIYIIIFLVFSLGRFFVPAKFSIIPSLVEKRHLLMANSLVNMTGMIAAVLGFGISGVLVEWLGARSGFYLDSLSFLVSGTLIFFIYQKGKKLLSLKVVGQEIVEVIRKSVLQEIKEGVAYFVRKKHIRFTAAITFILWSALGSIYVVLIVFVQKTLQSATKDLGLLIMFLGAGLFIGSLLYGRFGQKFSAYRMIFACLFLSGMMLVVFALAVEQYPYFKVAAGLSFLLGILIAPIMIASNTIIHKASDNEMMAKTFSSLEIVMHLGFLLFMFISSILAEWVSNITVLAAVGIFISLLGLGNLFFSRKIKVLLQE